MSMQQPIDDFTAKKAMIGVLVVAGLLVITGGAGTMVFSSVVPEVSSAPPPANVPIAPPPPGGREPVPPSSVPLVSGTVPMEGPAETPRILALAETTNAPAAASDGTSPTNNAANTNGPAAAISIDAETAGQSIAAGAAIATFWKIAWQKSWPFLKTMVLKFLAVFKSFGSAGVNVNAPSGGNANAS